MCKFVLFAEMILKLNKTTIVMAGRKKGDGLGRFGGRTKGTPNKTTKTMKELVAKFAEDNFQKYIDAWEGLEDKDKVSTYNAMLKFVVPTARDEEADDKDRQSVEALFSRLFNKEQ